MTIRGLIKNQHRKRYDGKFIMYEKMSSKNVHKFSKNADFCLNLIYLYLVKQFRFLNNVVGLQIAGLYAMRQMYFYFTSLLECRGIGMFYEFYHDKALKELLSTNGSILCGNSDILVSFYYWQLFSYGCDIFVVIKKARKTEHFFGR